MLVSESLSSYLSYYCFKREVLISEMFVFYLSGCVLVLSGVELKQNVVAGTWGHCEPSHIYCQTALSPTSSSISLRVLWNTSIAAVVLGFCFTIRADGFTILYSKSAKDPSGTFVFSLTYKVSVNLLSLHMAFYSSCDLLYNLLPLYSNWLPAYFFVLSQIHQSLLPEAAGGQLGKMCLWSLNPLPHLFL